jgi:HPt (histidine-containing phosphotransfer) domain-containing protein
MDSVLIPAGTAMPEMSKSHTCDRAPGYPEALSEGCSTPLDRARLLEMFEDEPLIITKLLNLFIEETRADMAGLVAACGSSDSARIAFLAHRVKGAAANIAAEPLRREAARLEALGRKGELSEADDSVARLQAEFEAFNRYVTKHT